MAKTTEDPKPTLIERVEQFNQNRERYDAELREQQREIEMMQADSLNKVLDEMELLAPAMGRLELLIETLTDGRASTTSNIVGSFRAGSEFLKREQERIAALVAEANEE